MSTDAIAVLVAHAWRYGLPSNSRTYYIGSVILTK